MNQLIAILAGPTLLIGFPTSFSSSIREIAKSNAGERTTAAEPPRIVAARRALGHRCTSQARLGDMEDDTLWL